MEDWSELRRNLTPEKPKVALNLFYSQNTLLYFKNTLPKPVKRKQVDYLLVS